MTDDALLERLRRADPARGERFPVDPGAAPRLRAAPAKAPARRATRLRAVVATSVGVVAIGALIAVLPKGTDAGARSPAGPATTAGGLPAGSVDVNVWVSRRATPAQIDALRSRIDGLVARGVAASATFTSAKEALDELRGRLRDPTVLDQLPGNPMPASFRVRTSDPGAVVAAVEADPAVDRKLRTSVAPARRASPAASP